MKILGIVILYYPDADIISNISSYINSLDTLIIWNNTPEIDRKKEIFKGIKSKTPIIFMNEENNVGIGKALNNSANYALENNFTHLLTMDQDSFFNEYTFHTYLKKIKENKDTHVAAYCVNTNSTEILDTTEVVELFITSGTIIITDFFKKIGNFRDDFFIDAIDTEYSFRIRKNKYKILQFRDVFMHHKLGNPTVTPFLWGKLISPNYSAVRTYYIVRNHIILRRLYDKDFSFSKGSFKTIFFWRPICILFVEKNKLQKAYFFLRGIYDGIRLKTGAINHII
ncbi:glycosyltransferase [Massilibacteroides vaginae]|uniref:glycosyltransferase n=1 Tax=Massilibacteroides vaginae TaxID=1673718 RepID=UPI000A1CE8FF|nr:glycosyltransferase [Massilibacteroides vaginae]